MNLASGKIELLEIKNLNKSFDGVHAVQDFSHKLEPGKITSLIGPNGAGKSTLFNIITGFITASSGQIIYNNISLSKYSPWRINKFGISRTFQNLRLFKKLIVLDNIMLGIKNQNGESFINALIKYSPKSSEHKNNIAKTESILDFIGIKDKQDELAENLSYGQQKLLSIGCCLAGDPDLLLLDEPVSGIQPEMIIKIKSLLNELVEKQNKTIFLIEHDIEFVNEISDTIIVMDDGKKIAEGIPLEIKNNPEILEAYLS